MSKQAKSDGARRPIQGERSRPVLFLIELADGVYVDGGTLGSTWPVLGTPSDCKVALPLAGPVHDGGFDELVAPQLPGKERALAAFERHSARERHDVFWGKVGTRKGGVPMLACVRHLVGLTSFGLEQDDETKREWADETGRVLDHWVASVTEWLEVLAQVDVRPNRPTGPRSPTFVFPLPVEIDEAGAASWFTTMNQFETIYGASSGATKSHWASAVRHANASDQVPPEHLVLRDARAAMRRDDLRRAVIDAGTACEVALAGAIRARLSRAGSNDDAIAQLLKNASGVIELFDLLVALGTELSLSRGRVVDRLAGKRNEAVHGGVVPSREATAAGLRVAEEILGCVRPLT